MAIKILEVQTGSIAERNGIAVEDILLTINGETVIDEIDYQDLIAHRHLDIKLSCPDGQIKQIKLTKHDWEPLGITLDESIILKPRVCKNHCVFCFIDQMPEGMRSTLYVKDDDWRLSLMMGNFVTLTNVDDKELDRIIRRKASPLYISVHATDPEVRCKLTRNPNAGKIMDQLRRLKENGLEFHCQIVCCPGLNDGSVLEKSVMDLIDLYPAAQSLAIVPVGLTCHRNGLEPIKPFDHDSAAALLDWVQDMQNRFMEQYGTRFVFPSDEFYCLSGRPIPEEEAYEGFPQIENGVGMLRLFENDVKDALDTLNLPTVTKPRKLLIGTGTSAASFITHLCQTYAPPQTEIIVKPIINHFFGPSVTVTGLLVGKDLLEQLQGIECDEILLCRNMFKEGENRFLDDMTSEELSEQLGKPIRITENSGEGIVRGLYGMEEKKNNG